MSMDDIVQAPQAVMDPSSSSSPRERMPSAEEDPAAMTIEFLRARLLSERSVSKAARQRAQQLAKKVSELEERLEAEIQLRKKLEADRIEIISKYRAELSAEYGDFFASSFGEAFSRNDSVSESPKPGTRGTDEGFLLYAPNDDEEGLSASRMEQLDRSGSSQHLNHEETIEEDEEIDHTGREKGVLSWEKRKGLKKEYGYGIDWLGRSLSQRSLASADGESPQKRWAGKSVRQIRKKEIRSYEGDPGQIHLSEEFDEKSGHPEDMKDRLQCEDERDTEVERVLERQAELIEQFEAEENAQRAWEEKFKEGKALANCGTGEGTTQSDPVSTTDTRKNLVKKEMLVKDDDATLVEDEGISLSESPSDFAVRYLRKVHPDDCHSSTDDTQEKKVTEITSRIACEIGNHEQNAAPGNDTFSIVSQSEEVMVVEESTEPTKKFDESVVKDNSSGNLKEDLGSSSETEKRVEQSFVEVGKSQKYKKHLSSSFRFPYFADADPATGGSPQMPGFATFKQDTGVAESFREAAMEVVHLDGAMVASEQVVGSGFSDSQQHDSHISPTASLGDGIVDPPLASGNPREETDSQQKLRATILEGAQLVDPPLASGNPREATDLQQKSRATILEGAPRREQLVSSPGSTDNMINYSMKEEVMTRRIRGQSGSQDMLPEPGRHFTDLPLHPELVMRHPQFASKHRDGIKFDNSASLLDNRSGSPVPVTPANAYEDTALRSHRRSVDGFDRLADVLRALQLAKQHVESSNEQPTLYAADTAYRNGYDGRDAFYVEAPRFPPTYAASQRDVPSVPYSSPGSTSLTQNIPRWGASTAVYGVGTSRQLLNAPFVQYTPRISEPQDFWPPPPPSQGIRSSNLYHYNTRHHR